MNQLQDISTQHHGNVFVTLNPPAGFEPRPDTVIATNEAEHPMFTAEVGFLVIGADATS